MHSRGYGLRTLLPPDDHVPKVSRLQELNATTGKDRAGMERIANLLKKIFKNGTIEDTSYLPPLRLPIPEIATTAKETE